MQRWYHNVRNDEAAGKLIAQLIFVRTASLFGIVILTGALLLWHYASRRSHSPPSAQTTVAEIPHAEAQDEEPDALSSLQDKMVRAEEHLDSLKASLDKLKSTSPSAAPGEGRAQDIDKRIVDVERRMNEISRASRETVGNAQAYQTGIEVRNVDNRLSIERQMQQVDDSIAGLQNQIAQIRATPTTDQQAQGLQVQALQTQIANQKTLRDQLASRRRALGERAQAVSAMAHNELQAETEGLAAERVDLERQLRDLRAEQESWKRREASQGEDHALRQRRVSELEQEISAQEDAIAQLRNRYQSTINK